MSGLLLSVFTRVQIHLNDCRLATRIKNKYRVHLILEHWLYARELHPQRGHMDVKGAPSLLVLISSLDVIFPILKLPAS